MPVWKNHHDVYETRRHVHPLCIDDETLLVCSPILSSPNQPTQTHRRHGPYPIIIGCPQQAGGNVPAQMTTFWGFVGRPVVAVLYDDLVHLSGRTIVTFTRQEYTPTRYV
jgi:hypothetical protein